MPLKETVMPTITQYLETDHHRCDLRLAEAERCVGKRQWDAADTAFNAFHSSLQQHLDMEERVLFPAFEQTLGTPSGPTIMMRAEHQQMRQIVTAMQDALLARDAEEFSSGADILHIMMGQHNMKEESILYPMADRFMEDQADDIIGKMQELHRALGAE
jgi:iron-sulfur cluster repair protein YtfE (RIC family)